MRIGLALLLSADRVQLDVHAPERDIDMYDALCAMPSVRVDDDNNGVAYAVANPRAHARASDTGSNTGANAVANTSTAHASAYSSAARFDSGSHTASDASADSSALACAHASSADARSTSVRCCFQHVRGVYAVDRMSLVRRVVCGGRFLPCRRHVPSHAGPDDVVAPDDVDNAEAPFTDNITATTNPVPDNNSNNGKRELVDSGNNDRSCSL